MRRRNILFAAVAVAVAVAVVAGAGIYAAGQQPPSQATPPRPAPVKAEERLEVPPPPFTDGIFPCSACHKDLKVNRTRRTLTSMHEDINFTHDAEHRWCLDCHDANDRDHLHLASGELVPFEESYRLCGQCHGEKFRDWRAGVHGRRTGEWNGHKKYLLCANCHNPHQPHFKPIVPKPAPVRPSRPPK